MEAILTLYAIIGPIAAYIVIKLWKQGNETKNELKKHRNGLHKG